ncbi:zeta toxin family protein [Patescibacteria group bacterium]|nr:zeta toxin family protein [Patescibacteria group bacterium]
MNDDDIKQSEEAYKWIKAHEKTIIDIFISSTQLISDSQPVALFMAGPPGVGKTEVSKQLINRFSQKPVRIDADEIRIKCPGYIGINAHIYQKAATKGVHILYDYALKKNINVILDGTFAYANALENIKRSLDHRRKVEIFYVYQDPLQAWDYTKKREEIEKRRVDKDIFINSYFKSRENVNLAKEKYGADVELNLVVKDFEKNLEKLELNIQKIESYLKKVYNSEELEEILL